MTHHFCPSPYYIIIMTFHAQFTAVTVWIQNWGKKERSTISSAERQNWGGCTSGSLDCRSLVRATFSVRLHNLILLWHTTFLGKFPHRAMKRANTVRVWWSTTMFLVFHCLRDSALAEILHCAASSEVWYCEKYVWNVLLDSGPNQLAAAQEDGTSTMKQKNIETNLTLHSVEKLSNIAELQINKMLQTTIVAL